MEFGNYPYHFFVIRFVFSMLSYGSSVPGGIFMPILVLDAIEKAPITAIMLLTKMVGTVQQVLPLIIVTFISYYVLDLLDGKPIYEALRLQMGYK